MAEILAFPLCRRLSLIQRQADRYQQLSHEAAERNLTNQLEIQRNTLLRKGVMLVSVEREVAELERAIRWKCPRSSFAPEGRST